MAQHCSRMNVLLILLFLLWTWRCLFRDQVRVSSTLYSTRLEQHGNDESTPLSLPQHGNPTTNNGTSPPSIDPAGNSSTFSTILGEAHDQRDSKESSVLSSQAGNEANGIDSSRQDIPIVVQLSGELGNHLFKLALGYAVQKRLWDQYQVTSHLILRHQDSRKWESAMRDVQLCFPRFRSFDFSMGNTPEFDERLQQQNDWLGSTNASKLILHNGISSEDVNASVSYLYDVLMQQNQSARLPTVVPISNQTGGTANSITLPFLYVESFASWEVVDDYYYQLRKFFAFDKGACCADLPQVDEHVFHFRNYEGEMRRRAKSLGFEELGPNQTVLELFGGHDETNLKLAMTTRIINTNARAYIDAFSQAGWSARVMRRQTGTQGFCFLMHAQRELVGMARSTYVSWAALLGDTPVVKLYSMNTTITRAKLRQDEISGYRWRTPELQNRIQFLTFDS